MARNEFKSRGRLMLVLVACGILSACANDAAREHALDLERQAVLMERSQASKVNLCKMRQRIEDAWLQAGDKAHYLDAQIETKLSCSAANYEQYENTH